MKNGKKTLGVLRIVMGWMMLWPFIDKLWGVKGGMEKAWINGNSPTTGFLTNAPHGPFADIFHAMAGSGFVDWIFMAGLLLIGLSLILGIGVRVAGYSGALMMLLLWSAVLPPEHNPIIDDHIVYMLVFLYFALTPVVGEVLGLGKWWSKTSLVKKHSWMQ